MADPNLTKDISDSFETQTLQKTLPVACIFSFRISKVIPDKINLNLRSATKINQWENTNDDISLFKSIKSKQSCKFILFDIKIFTLQLLRNSYHNPQALLK